MVGCDTGDQGSNFFLCFSVLLFYLNILPILYCILIAIFVSHSILLSIVQKKEKFKKKIYIDDPRNVGSKTPYHSRSRQQKRGLCSWPGHSWSRRRSESTMCEVGVMTTRLPGTEEAGYIDHDLPYLTPVQKCPTFLGSSM